MRSEAQFRTQVRMVVADDADIGQLSTGERIAVAFVLNRPTCLNNTRAPCSSSVDRLGIDSTRAALRVQRNGC
jgi:hypothetical protein